MEPIKIHTEYITLQQVLKKLNIISSGGAAKYYLSENPVLVNDETEQRRGRKIYPKDIITINNKRYVIE